MLLDGYSYPVGRDEISTRWQETIDELHALAELIRERVAAPDRTLDLVGNTLREAVLWAAATDVYLTPQGTTQHKVAWLTDAPGIMYAPESYAAQGTDLNIGAFAAEGAPAPRLLVGATVSEGDRRGGGDTRRNLENVALDVETVTSVVLDLIEHRRRSAQTTSTRRWPGLRRLGPTAWRTST